MWAERVAASPLRCLRAKGVTQHLSAEATKSNADSAPAQELKKKKSNDEKLRFKVAAVDTPLILWRRRGFRGLQKVSISNVAFAMVRAAGRCLRAALAGYVIWRQWAVRVRLRYGGVVWYLCRCYCLVSLRLFRVHTRSPPAVLLKWVDVWMSGKCAAPLPHFKCEAQDNFDWVFGTFFLLTIFWKWNDKKHLISLELRLPCPFGVF